MQRHKAMHQVIIFTNFREILNLFKLQKMSGIKFRAVFGIRNKEAQGTLGAIFATKTTMAVRAHGLFTLSLERFENEDENFLLGTHSLSGLNSDKGNITRRLLPVKVLCEVFFPAINYTTNLLPEYSIVPTSL
jgi:hypothetical protein